MATLAERDEVFFSVTPRITPQFFVVNLESVYAATVLRPPRVSFEDLQPKLLVCVRIEFDSPTLWRNPVHDAISSVCSRTACRCDRGKELESSRDRL